MSPLPAHLPLAACLPPAENSSFVDNNAFVFGDDIYVDDPSECMLCTMCMLLLGRCRH
jgi:hypothetical protein